MSRDIKQETIILYKWRGDIPRQLRREIDWGTLGGYYCLDAKQLYEDKDSVTFLLTFKRGK